MSADQTAPEDVQSAAEDAPETPDEPTTQPEAPEAGDGDENDPPEDAETFPRAYVERLRDESARYRTRAQRADDLAAALWTERVTASGRLADPSDLPMPADADPLDADAVTAAIDGLLDRKPHLASRRVAGDIGQGVGGGASSSVDLAGMLRARA